MTEKQKNAVNELLNEDCPENFIESIDLMFEAWYCSEYCNGTTIDQRSVMLTHVKALKQFLKSIETK